MSVAWPFASGASGVGPSAAWKRSAEVPEPIDREPDDGDGDRRGRGRTDQDEAARPRSPRRLGPGLDARPERGRRLDLECGAPQCRDGELLLGEPVRELRRRGDLRLERGNPVRRERPVGQSGQLGRLREPPASSSRERLGDTSTGKVTAAGRHGNRRGPAGVS